jgi:hypothetical protein
MSGTVIDIIVTAAVYGLPLVLVGCLTLGIVSRNRGGRRLLVFAAVALALYFVVTAVRAAYAAWLHSVPVSFLWALIPAWCALACAVLIWVLSVRRGWPFRRLTGMIGVLLVVLAYTSTLLTSHT